jgi:hypothetical protein
LEEFGEVDHVRLSRSTVFGLLDAAGQFLTFGASAVRESALEEAAKVADRFYFDVSQSQLDDRDNRLIQDTAHQASEMLAEQIRALAAQGTEAQRAATPKSGVVHDGPVAEGDAPERQGQ